MVSMSSTPGPVPGVGICEPRKIKENEMLPMTTQGGIIAPLQEVKTASFKWHFLLDV